MNQIKLQAIIFYLKPLIFSPRDYQSTINNTNTPQNTIHNLLSLTKQLQQLFDAYWIHDKSTIIFRQSSAHSYHNQLSWINWIANECSKKLPSVFGRRSKKIVASLQETFGLRSRIRILFVWFNSCSSLIVIFTVRRFSHILGII